MLPKPQPRLWMMPSIFCLISLLFYKPKRTMNPHFPYLNHGCHHGHAFYHSSNFPKDLLFQTQPDHAGICLHHHGHHNNTPIYPHSSRFHPYYPYFIFHGLLFNFSTLFSGYSPSTPTGHVYSFYPRPFSPSALQPFPLLHYNQNLPLPPTHIPFFPLPQIAPLNYNQLHLMDLNPQTGYFKQTNFFPFTKSLLSITYPQLLFT